MRRATSAVAGGVAGTALMSLVLALMEVQMRYALHIFDIIARFVRQPGNLYVGFLLFAAIGSVVWPLLFVALQDYVPHSTDAAVRGMVFGTLLWVPFVLTGLGDLGWPALLIYATFTLFAHLVYGFTLGAVYDTLSDERASTATRQ